MTYYERVPKIRPDLRFVSTEIAKARAYIIQDPLELAPPNVVLRSNAIQLLLFLAKSKSLVDLQSAVIRMQGGAFVSIAEIQAMIERFDELYLLDSDRFRTGKKEIRERFSRLNVRKPVLAGKSYPESCIELTTYIESILKSVPPIAISSEYKKPKILMAPHIDISIAEKSYAKTYQYWPGDSIDRVLILGVGHNLTDGYFSVTKKDYEAPNGILRADINAFQACANTLGGAVAIDDFAHFREHSIEFQTLFINHLTRPEGVVALPILCGSFDGILKTVTRPKELLIIGAFVEALRGIAQDPKTLIILSVDLSHVGPKFGHNQNAAKMEKETFKRDEELLKAFVSGDLLTAWDSVCETGNHYNVCGFSSMAIALELLGKLTGEILDYQYAVEDETHSAVSFASCVLWEQNPAS